MFITSRNKPLAEVPEMVKGSSPVDGGNLLLTNEEYSELIKKFETIREYLRDFYIFGFKTRNDFTRNSARKYDNERRRAEDWLRGAMSFHTNESGKSYFISADSRVIPENPLYKAFKNKSFTGYDICLHFYILDAIADGNEHSLRQIADSISYRWQAVPGAPNVPDDATIRNKLNEYVTRLSTG